MDAFSWFRKKRQGIRPVIETDVRIPLMASPTVGYVVYYRDDTLDSSLDESALNRLIRRWLADHCDNPLRSTIEAFLEQSLLSLLPHDRASLPEPPDDILRAYNPGEDEERRYRQANQAVLIGSPDLLAPPRIGLWAVLAASRALSAALSGGVIVDPLFPRLLPLASTQLDLPAEGHVRLVDHILIPYSVDLETGLAWITTKGMDRFGLPELELRDVPPNLVNGLMPVMNGVAQRLAESAMETVLQSSDEAPPDSLIYPAQFWFSLADIRRAYARSSEPGPQDEQLEDEGTTLLRLEMTHTRSSDGDDNDFLRLVPPHGVRYDPGVWLNGLLADLFGSDPEIAAVETGNTAMESAHQEARRELPLIHARFRVGFRSGEVLHIKHGFPTEGGGHEYMWVVVTGWDDGRVQGYLANDPQYRRDLRAGQAVTIGEDEVYDWLIVHLDGRIEGAYTNRALDDEGKA